MMFQFFQSSALIVVCRVFLFAHTSVGSGRCVCAGRFVGAELPSSKKVDKVKKALFFSAPRSWMGSEIVQLKD